MFSLLQVPRLRCHSQMDLVIVGYSGTTTLTRLGCIRRGQRADGRWAKKVENLNGQNVGGASEFASREQDNVQSTSTCISVRAAREERAKGESSPVPIGFSWLSASQGTIQMEMERETLTSRLTVVVTNVWVKNLPEK